MKKSLCILCFLVFASIFATPVCYSVLPIAQAQSPAAGQISTAIGILIEGHELSLKYGSRPPYLGPRFAPKQPLDDADAQNVIPYLIACESRDHSVKIVDSNGFFSYGIGQEQSSTIADFNAQAHEHWNPMNPIDAVASMEWALEHGYLYRWSCASILKIVSG